MLVHANKAHVQDHTAKLFQRNEVGVLFKGITNTGYVEKYNQAQDQSLG